MENHSNCIMLEYMSHFKILIQHYLRCLFRIAVTASSTLTLMRDYAPLLHVMYDCVRGTYFSWQRLCPYRELLKKTVWNMLLEVLFMSWKDGKGSRGVLDLQNACNPPHCRLSPCPVNWNTKQSRVDEGALLRMKMRRRRWWWWGLLSVSSNLHCSLGIDWGTSKRDRHTVTGKMNCHLAFLNLVAASNWPLWTMWRDTDWVLPPPSQILLGSWGRAWFNSKRSGSPCKALATSTAEPGPVHQTWSPLVLSRSHYFIVLPRYTAS